MFFKRNQRRLFVMIPREYTKCQWETVSVHEEPHLYDWIWPVFLTFTILTDPVCFFHFEEKVRAVIVKNRHVMHLPITVVQGCLDEGRLFLEDIQRAVDIVKFVCWRFQKTLSIFQRETFGAGIQDSCIDQIAKDLSKVRLETVFLLNPLAGLIDSKVIEHFLKEQISTAKRSSLIRLKLLFF